MSHLVLVLYILYILVFEITYAIIIIRDIILYNIFILYKYSTLCTRLNNF